MTLRLIVAVCLSIIGTSLNPLAGPRGDDLIKTFNKSILNAVLYNSRIRKGLRQAILNNRTTIVGLKPIAMKIVKDMIN